MHTLMLAAYFATCPLSAEIDAIEEHSCCHVDAYDEIVEIQIMIRQLQRECTPAQLAAFVVINDGLDMLRDCID